MSSLTQLIRGGKAPRALNVAFGGLSRQTVASREPAPRSPSPVAFCGLVDLVRSTHGAPQGTELCEECKTVNRSGAAYCKACMHKLPAYFACARPPTPRGLWGRLAREGNSSAWDHVAAWAVLISLVILTANIPIE